MKNILKIFAVLFLALNIMPVLAVDDSDASSQSKANRLLTSASSAATGIGGMELAQGLSEQRADREAEQSMSAYISTMRCSYGNGKQTKASTEEIELPGGNNANMMKYRTEYTALAADLKERKTALNMTPGIESEEILDKSQMELYSNENVGITAGNYASLYRAQMLGSESDQAQLDEAQQTSKTRVIGGAVAAGAGVIGGIVGDELINQSLSSSTKTAQTCTESGGTWQGARCHCPDGFIQRTKTGPCFEEKPTEPENPTPPQDNPNILSNTNTDQNNANSPNSEENNSSDIPHQTQAPETEQENFNINLDFDDDLLLEEDESELPEEVVSYEQEQRCRAFNGNWENGQCFCTPIFAQNNYIKCINRQIGNGSTEVISTTAQVTGQELVLAEPVDNNFVWNGTNSNDSSTPQAKKDNSAAAVGTDANKTEANSATTKQDINNNPRDNSNNQNSNKNSQQIVSSQEDQKQQTQEQTCGVVGKKECNSNYYVCASDSDCTSDKLPANATAGHCWKSGSRSVCTATACKDGFEPTSGYCKKREVADRNANAQKTNTSTVQRPNNTNQKKSNTTNTTNKHDMVYYYNQTSKKVKSAQGGSSGIWKVTYTDGSYMSGITKCETATDWHNHECYSCSCKADIFNIKSEPHTFMKNPWQEITGCFNTKEQCNNKCADQCAFNANQSILPKFITQSKLED